MARNLNDERLARSAEHDQDWEACKEWWLSESVENRLLVQATICDQHEDPFIERMSIMAQLTLDRLLIEVWPGPKEARK